MLRLRGASGRIGAIVCLVAVLAVIPLDVPLHDLAFRYVVSHEVRLVANGVSMLGTAWASAGLLGTLGVVAYRTADTGLLQASLGGLVGIVAGSLAIQVVKRVACRARPHLVDGWGVDVTGPPAATPAPPGAVLGFFYWPCLRDSRYQSFPSGHATVAFAVAAALTQAVPSRRRTWLAGAGGVGLSRVLLNAHFLSDVLGAAVLGWWAGRLGLRLVAAFVPATLGRGRLAAGIETRRGAGASSA